MTLIAAVTGYSTSGKTFISQILDPFQFAPLVSHTTRSIRPGEMEALDYYYTSEDEFTRMITSDEFIEHVEFCGFRYGLSKTELTKALSENKTPIHVCTPEGVVELKKYAEEIGVRFVSAFIEADDQTMMNRMLKRLASVLRSESEQTYTLKRLATALTLEKSWEGKYNYVLEDSKDVASIAQNILDLTKMKIEHPEEEERENVTPVKEGAFEQYVASVLNMTTDGIPRNGNECWKLAGEILDEVTGLIENKPYK